MNERSQPMKCPYCGNDEVKVVDSRSKQNGMAIRRRRQCDGCGRRFTTYEYVEEDRVRVRKRDGRTEDFDRAKLKRGLRLALVKRPFDEETIESLTSEIEDACAALGQPVVDSERIGELVMDRLRVLDEVAYIRFASVYRRFQDLGAFRRELEKCRM